MNYFKITPADKGKKFIFKPILNVNDFQNSIMSYKFSYNRILGKFNNKYMCYCLMNGEFVIFRFGEKLSELLSQNPEIFIITNTKAIEISVNVVDVDYGTDDIRQYLDFRYDVIEDVKYGINTEEKKSYLVTLMEESKLNLENEIDLEKTRFGDIKITIFAPEGEITTTLGEIYSAEEKYQQLKNDIFGNDGK